MRRIALISEHASPLALAGSVDSGGQNIYVGHLARELARQGHRVDIFTRRDRPFLPPIFHWRPGVRVIHVPAGEASAVRKEDLLPLMPEFGAFLLDFFRRQRRPYDVVHANFFMSGLAAREPARAIGAPLVMTFHALGLVRRRHQCEADLFPDARFDIEADLVRQADRIIAECPQDQDDLCSLYQADRRKLDIVPCGFDPAELRQVDRSEARQALGWNRDEFAVLQLGRMVPRKGIANVVRGIARLRRRGLHARLYVVGGNSELPNSLATPEIGRLSALAEELGVRDQISFLGRSGRGRLHLIYSAADVFVSTPWYEPFGITPVEAMACGVPVVGASVGGIRSTVEDGRTGFLVPPEDPDTLADRLLRLYEDAALRARMGAAGKRRAYARYTWRRVAADVAQSYERAMQHRPALQPRRAPALSGAVTAAGAAAGVAV